MAMPVELLETLDGLLSADHPTDKAFCLPHEDVHKLGGTPCEPSGGVSSKLCSSTVRVTTEVC